MDGQGFDRLTRSLVKSASRGGLLRALAGGARLRPDGAQPGGEGAARPADDGQFDELARLVFARRSRRAALAALLGAALVHQTPAPAAAKGHQGHGKGKRRCYRKGCQPGAGKNNARCNFSKQTQRFVQLDIHGANLRNASFALSLLAEADLRGADLTGACLAGASLLNATVDDSTKLEGAIFCQTVMPDGSINDRDCGKGTRCCRTPTICRGATCEGEDCISKIYTICSWPFGTRCCSGMVCTPTGVSPLLTTCEAPCSSDQYCMDRFGPDSRCSIDLIACPYLGTCCTGSLSEHPTGG